MLRRVVEPRAALGFACLLVVSAACGSTQQPSASFAAAPSSASPTATPASTTPTPSPSPLGGMWLATSDVPRASASSADAAAAAVGINAFGLDLYRLLTSENDNLVFSPTSIALALGMARAGARGSTATEMDSVLHGVASDAHAGWLNALDQALAERNGTFGDASEKEVPLTLGIANSSFVQQGMTVEPAYLDALASRFGSGVRLVDFIGHTEQARQLINGWVDEQTAHRIPALLGAGALTPATRFALVNAIYLQAGWFNPFNADLTKDKPFTLGDGSRVQVPMMTAGYPLELSYAAGDGWQAVELPYASANALAMTLILPDNLASFEASLDGTRLTGIVSALKSRPVILTMPKFGVQTKADLAQLLSSLGMPTAFDPAAADFSGITPPAGLLHISDVIHQANIDVDEKGTTAAAATAPEVGLGATGEGPTPPPPIVLNVDHPFIFAVRDVPTGAVLFLGRVIDPSIAP